MKYLLALAGLLLASSAQAQILLRSYQTSFGTVPYFDATSLQYAAPSCGMAYGSYGLRAPTYIAPSAYSQIGFPAQTPVTIINNNNNAGQAPAGVLMGTVGVSPGANISVFQGRRFRFR